MRTRDQSSIFSTGGKFRLDYGLLLELHALTLVARSYALLPIPIVHKLFRRTSALHCLMCANTSELIHIKLILISALNKALISAALNMVRMCLNKPFIFVTDGVPYGCFPAQVFKICMHTTIVRYAHLHFSMRTRSNFTKVRVQKRSVASFSGLLSPNAVEG